MRRWATDNRYGNVTTAQFIALSEQLSGIDLDNFFDVCSTSPRSRSPGSHVLKRSRTKEKPRRLRPKRRGFHDRSESRSLLLVGRSARSL
jgi:hypothetical protein